ncbi:MAG: hypothetical protein ACK4F8_15560 [Aquabacterium sp.]
MKPLKKMAMAALCALALQGCAANDRVGLTFLFLNMGQYGIGVTRFDVDGRQLGGPGALGSDRHLLTPEIGGGKQMSYMPEKGRGPSVPEEIVVEWSVATPEVVEARRYRNARFKLYSPQWMEETARINETAPHYLQRIDLKALLTPELINQVKSDRRGTQLKLLVKFNHDKVDVTARAEKWR